MSIYCWRVVMHASIRMAEGIGVLEGAHKGRIIQQTLLQIVVSPRTRMSLVLCPFESTMLVMLGKNAIKSQIDQAKCNERLQMDGELFMHITTCHAPSPRAQRWLNVTDGYDEPCLAGNLASHPFAFLASCVRLHIGIIIQWAGATARAIN